MYSAIPDEQNKITLAMKIETNSFNILFPRSFFFFPLMHFFSQADFVCEVPFQIPIVKIVTAPNHLKFLETFKMKHFSRVLIDHLITLN